MKKFFTPLVLSFLKRKFLPVFLLTVVFVFGVSQEGYATNFTSTTSGNWNAGATWGGTAPTGLATDVITIASGTTVTVTAAVANSASITINSGGTLKDGGFGITVAGNWTNNGTYTATGTVTITGTSAISGNATQNFYNLTINASGKTVTATSPSTLTVANNFTLTAGTFSAPAQMNVAGGWSVVTGQTFTNNSGTVTFNGSGNQALGGTLAAQTFYNLTILNTGGTVTATLTTSLTVSNNFTQTSGNFTATTPLFAITGNVLLTAGTFTAATSTTVKGNWTNNGATFTPGTNTVTFSGTGGQTISANSASQTFYNLIINETAGQTVNTGGSITTLTVNNFTETTGNFTAPATFNVNGVLTLTAGTFTAGTQVTVAGNWVASTASAAAFNPNNGTVTFTGNSSTISTATTQNFYNVIINKTAGQTVTFVTTTTFIVNGNFTETTGNFTAPATLTVYGTLTLSAGTFVPGSTTTNVYGNWVNNGATCSPTAGIVTFVSGGNQLIDGTVASQTFYNFTVNAGSTVSVNGSSSTTAITVNNFALTNGNFTAPATLTINGTMVMTSGSFTAGTNITAASTWTDNAGGFNCGTGTVTFTGGASTLTSATGQNPTFYNVVINKTGLLSVTVISNLTVNNLTLTAGGLTYSVASATLNVNGFLLLTAGAFTMGGANSNLYINGNWTNNESAAAYAPSTTNTVTFQGSTQSLGGNYSTSFAYLINNATINLGSNGITIKDDFTNNGTFNGGTGTVTFTIATATTHYIYGNGPNFYNLTMSGASNTAILDASNINPLVIANNISMTAGKFNASGGQIQVGGNWSMTTGAVYVNNSGLVTFNGTGAQSIGGTETPQTFYDLEIGNSSPGIVTTSIANLTVTDHLTIDNGASFASAAGENININNIWENDGGTFTPSTGTVTFNGSSGNNCTINTNGNAPNQTFNNIVVATSGGTLVDASSGQNMNSLTLNGNFTLTSGGFYMPGTSMTVNGTTGVTLTAGELYGAGQLNIGGTTGSWTEATAAVYDGTSWCGCNAIVNFNGTGNQAIAGTATTQTFQDLVINKASGTFTISTPTTLNINDNLTLTAGTFTDALTSGIINIYNNGSPSSFTLTAGTMTVSGATSNLNVYGPGSYTAGTFSSSGTVTYTDNYGNGQEVMPGTYVNLTFDNNGKTLAPGTIAISGVFNAGTGINYTTTGNTISFTGNTSQVIPAFNYDGTCNLESNDYGYGGLTYTTAKVLPTTNLGVNGVFSYATPTGNFTLGNMNLLLGPNGSIAGGTPSATHMIVYSGTGRLIKAFSTGAQTYTYPVGIGTSYLPVTLAFDNVTNAGEVGLTMPLSPAVDPTAVAPPATATNWLKDYWVLDNNHPYSGSSTMAFDYYSFTPTYTASAYNTNLTAGAGGESTMGLEVNNDVSGSAWQNSFIVSSHTALSPTATHITTLGDLTFATCSALVKTSDPANAYVCTSSGSGNVSFSVGFTGTPSAFQWYQNGVALSNTGIYSGATTAQLTLTGATSALSGDTYNCSVTGECGGSFTSNTATLGTSSGTPSQVASVTASPNTYHPGANVVFTATPGASNPVGTTYEFVEAFAQGASSFFTVEQNTTSTSFAVNNISAYGTSIKSPGNTWMFVYAQSACGNATGTFYEIHVIPPTTNTNPTTCGGSNGTITFAGLIPSNQYTINYSKNNVVQSQLTNTTDASGNLVMTNLSAGTYSNIVLQVLNQGSSDPSAPADAITLNGCTPNVYNVTYNNGTSTAGSAVSVCPGIANIGMANSDANMLYKLYESGTLVATYATTAAGAFNFTYTPLAGMTYTVTSTGSSTVSMTGSVILYTAPTAVISNSGLSGCASPGVALGTTGSSAGSGTITGYQWADGGTNIGGATGSTYTATATGTYTVIITSSHSCSTTSAGSSVTITASPTVSFSGLNSNYCTNASAATLTGSPAGGTFSGTGISGSTFTPSTAGAGGPYIITYTYSNGTCSNTSSQNTTVNAAPAVSFSGLNSSYCTNATAATLTGSPTGGTFSGTGISGSTFTPSTAGAGGPYIITYTYSNGTCSNTSSQNTTVNATPVVSFSGLNSSYCTNATAVTLTGSPTGGTFSGTGISGSTFTPSTAGAGGPYTITYTYSNGTCSNTSTNNTTVNASPGTVGVSPSSPSIVNGGSGVLLTASSTGATSFAWSPTTGLSPTSGATLTANPTFTETYTVTASNAANCSATGTVTVTVTGATSTIWNALAGTSDWFTAGNWSGNAVPTSTVSASIPNGVGIYPIITGINGLHAAVKDLNIASGGSVSVAGVNGVDLTVYGNLTNSGSSAFGAGAVVLAGSSAQTITGPYNITNLTINNSAGVTIASGNGNTLSVSGILTLHSGILTTNANLTLASTSSSSAATIDNFSNVAYTGSISGTVTAQRYYDASNAVASNNQHYFGSPVNAPAITEFGSGGTPGFVTPDANCDEESLLAGSPSGYVYTLVEDKTQNPAIATCGMAQWKALTSGNAVDGQGYSVYKAGAGTLSLTGSANLAGSYTLSGLGNSNWSNTTGQGRSLSSGWHLLSNPYSATLNISDNGSGFDEQVQVWVTEGSGAGSYQALMAGSTATLSAFQGFMVHVHTPNTTANYTINGSDRTLLGQQFLRTANQSELAVTALNTKSGLTDVTTVAFNPDATINFDPQYDANKFAGSLNRHTLYTVGNDNKWMAINTLPSIKTTSEVPVGFEPGVSGTYILSFNGLNTFDDNTSITLVDKLTKTTHDVKSGPYYFTADETDNWNRFTLVFGESAVTGINSVTDNGTIPVWSYENKVSVDFSQLKDVKATVTIYNLLGQEISSEKYEGEDIYTKTIDNVDAAFMLVRVTNGNQTVTKKVFITNAK